MLNVAGQLRNGRLYAFRERFAVRLAYIKDLDRTEHRNLDFFFFRDCIAVCIQQRQFRIGVELFFFDLDFIWRRRKDRNAFLTTQHMTAELILPFLIPGNERRVRALRENKHLIVDRVMMKVAHRAQIRLVLF